MTATTTWFRQAARGMLSATLPHRLFFARGSGRARSVYLTFDDGPDPIHTPRLLDLLRDRGVPATFFVVGRQVDRHPEIVRRMVSEGHAVGNHTYSHGRPDSVSARQLLDEIRRTDALLEPFLGRATRLFRPPHGKMTAAKLLRLWGASRTVVLWNADPKDFSRAEAGEVLDYFRDRPMQRGDVVLMHDNVPHSIEALPTLIDEARRRGLEFSTLADRIGPRADRPEGGVR